MSDAPCHIAHVTYYTSTSDVQVRFYVIEESQRLKRLSSRKQRLSNHSAKLCQGSVLYTGLHKKAKSKDHQEGLGNSMIILTYLYLVEKMSSENINLFFSVLREVSSCILWSILLNSDSYTFYHLE